MREEQYKSSNGWAEPDRIEEDIRQTQARIEDHIEALREDLSPGQMLDGLIKSLRGGPGGFLQNFSRQLRDNPIPVALLGTGIAWLMWNEKRESTGSIGVWGSPESSAEGETGERVREAGRELTGRTREYAGRAREIAGRTRERTRERASDVREKVSRARHGAMDAFEEQPLALGALGLAIGALLGSTGHRPGREIYGDVKRGGHLESGVSESGRESAGLGVSGEVERSVTEEVRTSGSPFVGSAERVNVPSAGPREPYSSAPQSGPARDIGTPGPGKGDPFRR